MKIFIYDLLDNGNDNIVEFDLNDLHLMCHMEIKHYAQCIRRCIWSNCRLLLGMTEMTDDRIFSTDKIWSYVLMDGHSG